MLVESKNYFLFRNKLSRFYLKECFQKTVVDEVGNSDFDHGVTSGQPEKEVEVIERENQNCGEMQ